MVQVCRIAALPAILLLCSCGPRISDRRVEKRTFPGGEILTSESHVETPWLCLRGCEPQRPSRLTLQLASRLEPEEVARLRPAVSSGCCLMESMKPIRLERSGQLEAILFGNYLFTKWDRDSPDQRHWSSWDPGQDLETKYFLRNFPCDVFAYGQNVPPPCRENPYRQVSLDLSVPVARLAQTAPQAGWPSVLVYSAPVRSGWQFDFERTLRENPALRYRPFPSDLQLEARILQAEGQYDGNHGTPEDFTRHFPAARAILQRTLPISTTGWTTVSAATGSARYSYEIQAAYGDPDPDWVTIYSRFSGWKGHDFHFLRVGEWLALGASGNHAMPGSASPGTTAGFVRLVHR